MHEKACILVVDDEDSQRKSLSLILKKKGYEVESAGTGKEALEKAQGRIISVSLVDINLPDTDGIGLVALLKHINPDMTVIMVTGFASVENSVQSLNAGASGFLVKPVNNDELFAKVQDCIERQVLVREKQLAEEALKKSEEKYRRLFENARDAILILNGETGEVVDANKFILDLLGYPLSYFVGKYLWELGFIKDKNLAQNAFTELKKKGYIRYEYLPLETKDGRSIDVEFISHVYTVNSHKIIQCNVRDITARKQVESALALAVRKLNLLSSINRHDIKNQIQVLKGYLDLSKESLDDPVRMSEYIAKEEKIAETIVHQISFTKDYENLGVNTPVWQDVNTVIRKVITYLPMRNIRVDSEDPGPEIFADPLFEKVFFNLIDNALTYGGERMTSIRVKSREENGVLVITVEDDGNGISAEDKKQLFTKGFGRHTGLGLYLSREILSITGITITENGEPGKGARFGIIMPKGMWRIAGRGV
jgi:PAS domain S-box-containing protein